MADQQNDDAQERTEQATPRKLEQAREKGQVARSRELATTAILLMSSVGFALVGPSMVEEMATIMSYSFRLPENGLSDDIQLHMVFMQAAIAALKALAPFLALMLVVAIGASSALGGLAFSAKALAFKWDKLDPVKGMKRVFSVNGVMELLKAFTKFVVITSTSALILWVGYAEMLSLSAESIESAMAHGTSLLAFSFVCLAAATLVTALFDVPFQLWNHARQLRMTRREVKDEFKETEGKPEVKSRIRSLQREVAQRRMMEAVPDADVVITNPSHFAVALRYKPDRMQAPQLVAKGADLVAARIKELAGRHDVPVVESPMLARAVFHSTRLGAEIPAGLYVAVAQVLTYVYRIKEWRGTGEPPELASELPIPDELKR